MILSDKEKRKSVYESNRYKLVIDFSKATQRQHASFIGYKSCVTVCERTYITLAVVKVVEFSASKTTHCYSTRTDKREESLEKAK